MSRRRPDPTAPKVVTVRPDPANPDYFTVDCNWEDEPRETPISLEAARKFAEGWKAEFKVEAAW